MTTTVVNLRHDKADVVIDRRSRWGNPHKIGDPDLPWCNQTIRFTENGVEPGPLDREGVIYHYGVDLRARLLREPDFLEPLRGKRLGCWCKPLACHGDVIVELLEAAA